MPAEKVPFELKISRLEFAVWRLKTEHDLTDREVGDRLGISREWANKCANRARRVVRQLERLAKSAGGGPLTAEDVRNFVDASTHL